MTFIKRKVKTTVYILLTILTILTIFTFISHCIYHRSNKATLLEFKLRNSGLKQKLSNKTEYQKMINNKKREVEYQLPNIKLQSKIKELKINNNKIYKLTNEKEKRIILYIHGGAYIKQPSSYHWKFIDKITTKTNSIVYFPIYPLAPNHTYQETFQLLVDLYYQIREEYQNKPIILMGDSAGGGLALSFSEYLAERQEELPNKLVLISPWVDGTMSNLNIDNYEKIDPTLSKYGLKESARLWAEEKNIDNYKISPIYGDLSNIPKTLLIVGKRELFYPDILLLHKKLKNKKIEHNLIIGKGLNHNYPLYDIPEAKRTIIKIKKFIASE